MRFGRVALLAASGIVPALMSFALVVVLPVSVFAQSNPWIGTWKVNVAKSTYDPGPAPTSSTHTFETSPGGSVKHTIDAVTAQGQKTHNEVIAQFDGKDYRVQGGQTNSTRAYRRLDDRTLEVTNKTDGKTMNSVRDVISPDGKTRTATQSGTDAQGHKINNVIVFDKQ